MGTSFPEIWNALAEDIPAELVRERKAGGNRMVPYITARTAMNRLDKVMGVENWWDAYERDPAGSDNIVCRLTLRFPDGREVTKSDAGAPGSTGDDGEDDKGAFSDAFKRAAVKFGVGRHLYGDGVFRCKAPAIAEPTAAPAESPRVDPPHPAPPAPAPARPGGNGNGGPPRTGRALFGWVKDMEQRHEAGLLKYLNGWGKLQDFPGRMIDWDADQVEAGFREASRKLAAIAPAPGEAPPPFSDPGGFRRWADTMMAEGKAHAIGTELRFPGSWLAWTMPQCVEVYRALMEHAAEDAAEDARSMALAN